MTIIQRDIDLNGAQPPEVLNCALFAGEAYAHRFILGDKTGAAITGSVSAKALRADLTQVEFAGEIQDGKAVVTLPPECYAVAGSILISVYISDGTEIDCIYQAKSNVNVTSSENPPISGGGAYESLATLLGAAGTLQSQLAGLLGIVRLLHDPGDGSPWWEMPEQEGDADDWTDSVTAGGVTVTRGWENLTISGAATADVYVLLNGSALAVSTGSAGDWGGDIVDRSYLEPAFVLWGQVKAAPEGLHLVYSDAVDYFDLAMNEEPQIGGVRLYSYPGEQAPLMLMIESGTVIPDGYTLMLDIIGTPGGA